MIIYSRSNILKPNKFCICFVIEVYKLDFYQIKDLK